MNIYEFAMEMELDGKKYYEDLSKKTDKKGLRTIFDMLAEDELRHYDIIKNFNENKEIKIESNTLKNANNIFTQMLQGTEDFSVNALELEVYKHAVNLEEESIEFYEKHREKAKSEVERSAFHKLILEEKKHKLILENILEFVGEPEKNRGVKTIDSDPEFARWNKAGLIK